MFGIYLKSGITYCGAGVIFCILLASCAAPLKTVTSSTKPAPSWIEDRPISSTHFVGVGSARRISDLAATQEVARLNALKDISQQIEVSIMADVKMHQSQITVNKSFSDELVLQKTVRSMTQAVLQDWEVVEGYTAPDGFYWCKIILDKKKYYDRVNKKINEAIDLAVDALAVSQSGSFDIRLRELYKGIIALDEFLGSAMRATVGGKEVILNTELPRRLQALLSGVEIRPNINAINLTAAATVPDTLGAYVFVNGEQNTAVALSWSASAAGVEPAEMPVRPNGLFLVRIKSVPASAGVVRITATINCGSLAYELLQRKFVLPAASFTISRQVPRIFLADKGTFGKQLLDRLTSGSAAKAALSRAEADLILSAQSGPSGDPVQTMGIYKAKALFTLILTDSEGNRILDVSEDVSAADAQSGSRAQANAEKVALEKAIKRMDGAF